MTDVGRKIKVPVPGDLPNDIPKGLRDVLENIIHALDMREGRVAKGTNTRFVTIQDLVDAGLISDGDIE